MGTDQMPLTDAMDRMSSHFLMGTEISFVGEAAG
jgi:hypothetical protein